MPTQNRQAIISTTVKCGVFIFLLVERVVICSLETTALVKLNPQVSPNLRSHTTLHDLLRLDVTTNDTMSTGCHLVVNSLLRGSSKWVCNCGNVERRIAVVSV